MSREPIVYAAAGTLFGFVLGYMAANAGSDVPRPAPSASATPAFAAPGSSAAGGSGAPVAAAAAPPDAGPVDPNEVRALESLAARDNTNTSVRVELGNLYMDHRRFDDAARWYREAIAIRPDPDVIVDLGACLVNGGKATEGLAEFDKALKIAPEHRKAAFNKGVALMELGRAKEAVAVWDDLLKRFPDDPQLQTLKRQIDQVRASAKPPA
jgi:cytochrome c-type biogenesis protein CcmH/NrfG